MYGIPDHIKGCLFDLDGVLTRTAAAHAEAWKEMFDDFLEKWSKRTGDRLLPFDAGTDYILFVDGKSRMDGVRSFLASRKIRLPEGKSSDPPSATTVHGLAARKNALLLEKIRAGGVEVFPGSVTYLRSLVDAGVPRGVVSASANCSEVLQAAGIADLLEVQIDGIVAEKARLRSKPAPDMFLAGAEKLGVDPPHVAVFEDALAGVQAGRAGGFGHVVGVNRIGADHVSALREHGADVVVSDLAELLDSPSSDSLR